MFKVGWRKSRSTKFNHSIGILFKFDTLRNFSRLTIHANNYYPKNIYVFRSIIIEFINNNISLSVIKYNHQHDDQFEMARPIIIDLNNHIGSQLKIHLYFDNNWILISEFTFDSFIINNNINKQSNHLFIYIIISILIIIIIILILPIIILFLIRYLFKKKNFIPINSSLSTTSSEIDTNSSHHHYATIGGSLSTIHIEGICGNSVYSTQRSFIFNLNQNLFISNERINIKKRIENRHQIIGGGEVNYISKILILN